MYTNPMSRIFANPNQLEEWVEAAQRIEARFGIEKALGYVIGEKFYKLVDKVHFARKRVRQIEDARKQPNYNPIVDRSTKKHRYVENLDETYERKKEIILEAEGLLLKFAFLINQVFEPYEIRKYFESHPRLGVDGHIATDEQYEYMVKHGAIKHTIETEVEDALIFGDMLKYFGM
jgi:hypothetical protein